MIRSYKASRYFTRLGPKTRKDYDRFLQEFEIIGHVKLPISRRDVLELAKPYDHHPASHKYFCTVASRLFNYGIEQGVITTNPAARIPRMNKAEPHRAWTEEDYAKFEQSEPPRPLLTGYLIGKHTGQRLGDVVKMSRVDYDGKKLKVRQAKTKVRLAISVHAELKAHLDQLPKDSLFLVSKPDGTAWSASGFGHAFSNCARKAGLDEDLTFHGLRHGAGKSMAEAHCTPHEIAAVLGHKTLSMVTKYTAAADQERLASAAILKLERKEYKS